MPVALRTRWTAASTPETSSRGVKQHLSSLGHARSLRRADQERASQPLLAALYLAGEGGLSDAQALRRAPEVVLFGHGDEIA